MSFFSMRLMKIELYVQKAMDLILSNSRKSLNARTACLFEEDLFEELYEDLLQSRHETAYKTPFNVTDLVFFE